MILVTGGTGFIGSHTVVELIDKGHDVVIIDNLSNSNKSVIDAIEQITGTKVAFIKADLLDIEAIDDTFKKYQIDAVIHFAGLKAVGEAEQQPLKYYRNNVEGSLNLISTMQKHGCKNIIFSSSATVYGDKAPVPYIESFPKNPINVYGKTKAIVEDLLTDIHKADDEWNVIILRYFNPIGAHSSGLIGENPKGIPNNLMPYISKVATGELDCLPVFGDDYETDDGTGVRDYIHVVDLAKGHVKALDKLEQKCEIEIFNLGTGKGYSVIQLIEAFKKTSGKAVAFEIKPRRKGDLAAYWANSDKAFEALGWKTQLTLNDMMKDQWRWQSNNQS